MTKRDHQISELPAPCPHQGYRPSAVARYTGLSVHLIYRCCARGDIRHVRVGRAITIPGTEVLRLTGATAA